MAGLIDMCGVISSPPRKKAAPEEHYGALLHAVVNQQLSVKAGAAIYGRLTERFGGNTPTPEQLLADDPEELRTAVGLSRSKVGFMRSLAEHILSGELELERLDSLSDEEVMAELVAVKGIGEWTAHMFLMSHLHRPDVMAPGDLGIKRAIEKAYGLEDPDRETMERLAERWRPHRTLAVPLPVAFAEQRTGSAPNWTPRQEERQALGKVVSEQHRAAPRPSDR